ncbi:transcriptional regulator [Candidatus Saccharibacteria bacterium 32-50-10]|nr:MAG: transcriptional regulator [Candidatus Saccharibacteria bacterium 32-50-10]
MIDALFGSKTRVKLLHLFLSNPEKSFYVREITRLIDEQINSVRRELANMLSVGIILSDSADNKLYYTVNQQYEHFEPLRQIFGDVRAKKSATVAKQSVVSWHDDLVKLAGIRLAVAAGVLVRGSASHVDLLLVGNTPQSKVSAFIKTVEKAEGRSINYTVLSYDDFYYRMSVRDKFISEIINGACSVLVDTERILTNEEGDR